MARGAESGMLELDTNKFKFRMISRYINLEFGSNTLDLG